MPLTTLYGFWRSTAAWRVRIALHLKKLPHETILLSLPAGDQNSEAYMAVNPQGLVPFLRHEEVGVGQSLAIIEYLDELYPDPLLLPGTALDRAKARAMAQLIACDIHPLNNLRVQKYLKAEFSLDQSRVDVWARHWIEPGFQALEAQIDPQTDYLMGNCVTLPDLCLVPQLYNARRVSTDLTRYPGLLAIEARLADIPAFSASHPDLQPDAVPV
ncbi:maleylacetoacetate isomerase [Sphingomonas paeninsulae]|uniref:maleylacetoacetate isomerase n=1 Tax=Sphingomonas paeninsulae TaxID=2319844 RepID=UPI002694B1C1